MPTTLKGWRPDGPVQSGLIRVFAGGPQSTGEAIGVRPNSCYGGIWTARWRSTSDLDPIRAATDIALNLADPNYETPALNSATVGGAGYMSGRVCEQPVFAYGNPGDTGPGLVDVVIEWQQWIPGV